METLSIIFLSIGIYILIKWFIVGVLFKERVIKWAKTIIKSEKKIRQFTILVLISALIFIAIGIILISFQF